MLNPFLYVLFYLFLYFNYSQLIFIRMKLLIVLLSFLFVAFFSDVGKSEVKTEKYKVEFSKNCFDVGINNVTANIFTFNDAVNYSDKTVNIIESEVRPYTGQNTRAVISNVDSKKNTYISLSDSEIFKGNSFAQINKLL